MKTDTDLGNAETGILNENTHAASEEHAERYANHSARNQCKQDGLWSHLL